MVVGTRAVSCPCVCLLSSFDGRIERSSCHKHAFIGCCMVVGTRDVGCNCTCVGNVYSRRLTAE